MASTIWNQDINAGEEWSASIILATSAGVARDLTGCSFSSHIKRHHKSAGPKETIAITIDNPSAGQMSLKLTNAQTTKLKSGRYVYDIEMNQAPTLTVSNPSGAMTVGETFTGGTSGATGTVVVHTPLTTISYVPVSGTFVADETLTGDSSAMTATLDSINTSLLERVIEGKIDIRPEVTIL